MRLSSASDFLNLYAYIQSDPSLVVSALLVPSLSPTYTLLSLHPEVAPCLWRACIQVFGSHEQMILSLCHYKNYKSSYYIVKGITGVLCWRRS